MSTSRQTKPMDLPLLLLTAGLVTFGLVMLASASAPAGLDGFGDSLYFVTHQVLFGLIPGIAALVIMSRIPYTFWKRHAWTLLLVTIVLLVLVFLPGLGAEFGTSRSWIRIGGFFSLQPAEVAKLTFLFYLAAWLEKRRTDAVHTVAAGLIPFVTALGAVMFLLVLQPDIGTMCIIVAMSLIVYFVAGAPLWHVGALVGAGAGLVALLISFAPYRAARFMTFLHPELDPQGIGYHINQALLAIGSGGWFGLGYGHSRQKFQYLPEVAGDSIFAVIAEEMGFVVSAALVMLFVLFFRRAIHIARHCSDSFGTYLVVGIASWLFIQALVNMGSMAGLVPMTGVTLPFVSYGGTSLAISLAAVGVMLNVSKYG